VAKSTLLTLQKKQVEHTPLAFNKQHSRCHSKPSSTKHQHYSLPSAADIARYARLALLVLPKPKQAGTISPQYRSDVDTALSVMINDHHLSATALRSWSEQPSSLLLVSIDDGSFAARVANDARFVKAL